MELIKSAVITSAAASCGCKHVGGQMGSEKRTAWWNQEVKAIHAKKNALRAWLTNKSSVHLTKAEASTAIKSLKAGEDDI